MLSHSGGPWESWTRTWISCVSAEWTMAAVLCLGQMTLMPAAWATLHPTL